ncbi:pPIWI-associating nuclease domain-containing protein (plasmid) [Streptomyces sp. LZ34]
MAHQPEAAPEGGRDETENEPRAGEETGTSGQVVPSLKGTPRDIASFLASQDRLKKFFAEQTTLGEIAGRAVLESLAVKIRPSGLDNLVANMRLMDQVGKGVLGQAHIQAAARIAEMKYEFGAVSSWRTALETQSVIGQFLKAQREQSEAYRSAFRQLSAVSRVQVHFTDWIVQQNAASKLITEYGSRPLSAWRDYVTGLPASPTLVQVKTSTAVGQSSAGLLGADALISDARDDEETTLEIVDRVESDVLEPWESGRLSVAAELRVTLSGIHSKAPDWLNGAWDLVRGKNPVSAALMAQCIVETIDQLLRAAAPEEEVVEWLPRSGRPEREWYSDRGVITRPMRVRYIAQKTHADVKLVSSQVDSWAALVSRLMNEAQGLKHGSGAENALKARALLVSAEAFLIALFMGA